MPQQGFQTQLVYGSTTPGAIPSANRLITNESGVELAINAADGRLFFKDNTGNVVLLADKSLLGASGNANITGGSINGATIGATTPSTGNFTSLIASSLTVPSLVGIVKSNGNAGFSVGIPGVDYISGAMAGTPNGVATLDGSGKVPLSQLPSGSGGLNYLGTWNAATNTPILISGVGTKGFFYKVSVAGSTNLDGVTSWVVGDQVIFNGTIWERVAESIAPVQSVNGMTGAVVITRGGLSAAASGNNSDITSLSGLTTALSASQGGTGVTTLAGLVKANGTNPFTAAVAGIDFASPTSGNNAQLLANNGSGGFSNVTIGAGLTYTGGVLNATGGGTGSGTVTSINVSGGGTGLTFGGGPVTTSGTINMSGTLSVSSGGTGKTTLSGILKGAGTSAIVSAVAGTDYAVPTNGTTSQLLANNGAGGFSNVTIGSGLSYSGGVLTSIAGGTGTVTSVNVSGGATGLSFSGGPITSSGTITLAGLLSVGSGGTGASSISGLVRGNGASAFSAAVPNVDFALPPAGTNSQLLANNGAGGFTNVTVGSGLSYSGGVLTAITGGTGTVTSVQASGGTTGLTFSGGPITSSGTVTLSGTLGVANGGTGVTTLTGLVKANGTSAFTAAVAGTDFASPTNGTNAQLLANNGIGGFSNVTVGSGLAYTGGVLSSTVTATIPDGSLTDVKIANNAAIQSSKIAYTPAWAGAISRSVGSRLGDFLSVKDFGAVGDGATNDSVAVAACIAAAKAQNKSVFWPDGSYSIPSLGIQSGRIYMWGLGNATIKGTFYWKQDTFPTSAGSLVTTTPNDPYFEAIGLNFQSTTNDYGLKLQTLAQTNYVSTFSIIDCRFYGYSGMWSQHMIGFRLSNCEFNSVNYGTYFEGCTDGVLNQCHWKNHAGMGTVITYASNHGAGGTIDREGGANIRFVQCSWMFCVFGVWAQMHTDLVLESCSIRVCDRPLSLLGCAGTKIIASYASASDQASTLFSGVTGYISPSVKGVALYAQPDGYTPGERSVSFQAVSSEFSSRTTGTASNQPVIIATGYLNTTYQRSMDTVSLTDCRIQQNSAHSATTLVSITNGTIARVLNNRFVSTNLSTTLTSAYVADATNYSCYSNDFTLCTQGGTQVKSNYERTLTTTFIQSADPAALAQPGDIWVQI
jgi:hypothetical protein